MLGQRAHQGDRGQLLIIGALLLATILVGIALILNSGIYAENLATRETTDTHSAITYTDAAVTTIQEASNRVTATNATTAAAAAATFNETIDEWDTATSRHSARRGTAVEFRRTPHVGWRLTQTSDRSFTAADDGGGTEWRVASGANAVAAFELDVKRDGLYDAAGAFDDTADTAFYISLTDGTDTKRLYLFRDSGDGSIIVHVGDPGVFADLDALRDSSSSCTATQARGVVDIRNGTVAGEECEAFPVTAGLTGGIDIHYRNIRETDGGSTTVEGQYLLVVNGSEAIATDIDGEPSRFNAVGDTAPTAQAVMYGVQYTVFYERSHLRHSQKGAYLPREETYP